MDKQSKSVKFVGGPLDGQRRAVPDEATIYKHEQPPLSDDILPGEIPVGFFPPMHEYIYQEEPHGSGMFFYKEQHHQ